MREKSPFFFPRPLLIIFNLLSIYVYAFTINVVAVTQWISVNRDSVKRDFFLFGISLEQTFA